MAIIDVVKYNGSPELLAWKYPSEELGIGTQLIVNESQEAILFRGGKAYDIFQSGRHTLETANLPLLSKVINLPFGGRSPFTAEVWFINKLFTLDVKWGTATPIQIQDPRYGIFVPVRSNGMFGIRVENSAQFLIKLVGTMPRFDRQELVKYFRGLYISKVKDAISSYIVHKKISVLEINAYIDELSTFLKERMEPVMEEYGIRLVNFYINDISIPENDSAVIKLKNALAKKAEMNIIGYNYQQERSFNTLEGAARNPSTNSAPLMGAGMGIGMGLGMGGAVGNAFGSVADSLDTQPQKICPKCHEKMIGTQRFCGACGFDTESVKEGDDKERKSKQAVKIVCANCGTGLNGRSKFCPECGKKYNPCPECGADLMPGAEKCHVCGYEIPKKCPKCGADLPRKVKFCPECGESLMRYCPVCSSVIEGDPKFCTECGEKLR